jgi:hypothetical protein
MRLFGIVDGIVNRFDRATWGFMPPFDMVILSGWVTAAEPVGLPWSNVPEAPVGAYLNVVEPVGVAWSNVPEAPGGTYTNVPEPVAAPWLNVT